MGTFSRGLLLLFITQLFVVHCSYIDEEFKNCNPPKWFMCRNQRCVDSSMRCNEKDECGDWSDEINCTLSKNITKCLEDEWQCSSKTQCIPKRWVCDGNKDCQDGSDEILGCSTKIPCEDGFLCSNKHCIPDQWVCDGVNDCGDNSDESGCNEGPEVHVSPKDCIFEKKLFECKDGLKCLELVNVCDGKNDCSDGSDEGSGCNAEANKCSKFGCSHYCSPTPDGPICSCPPGYEVKGLSKNCTDIDECLQYGICEQQCVNSIGSFKCNCAEGYQMEFNSSICKAEGGEALMVFSSKSSVRAFYLKSEHYYTVAKKLQFVGGVVYDGLHIYWSSVVVGEEAIVRSKEDGSDREMVVSAGLGNPENIAIDLVTGNIYFSDSDEQHIGVCTNDGISCTVLVNKDIDKPRAIALLSKSADLFWSDWGHTPMIARAGMDGSNPREFITSDIHWPNGIAIDEPNGRIYWCDSKLKTIDSVRFDGTDRRNILRDVVKFPYAIFVFEDKLFWSDGETREILSAEKFTGKNIKPIIREKIKSNFIYGLNIYHSVMDPKINNSCYDSDCSDICLLAPNNSYVCACPQDKQLGPDKHVCKMTLKQQVLLVSSGHKLYEVAHQILGRQQVLEMDLTSAVHRVGALAYNAIEGSVILSDITQKKIFSLQTNAMNSVMVLPLVDSEIGTVEGMDFDYIGNNLYWCDTERNTIEVMSMRTRKRTILLQLSGEVPLDIALVPEEGVMFIALSGTKTPHIDKIYMDGSGGRTHVIETLLDGIPVALTYDSELHRIFWADPGRGVMESTNVEGVDRQEFKTSMSSPVDLVSLGRDIFWTNWHSPQLHWSNKYKPAKEKKITLDLPDGTDQMKLLALHSIPSHLPIHQCQRENGGCSDLCLLAPHAMSCACPIGMELKSDNHTCMMPTSCTKNQFKCHEDQMCIFKSYRCNKVKDCPSGEDERNCEHKCENGKFTCSNGQCIRREQHCDGKFDCTDESDEKNCSKESTECESYEYQCSSGQCINKRWLCDHKKDCKDGSDELECEAKTCSEKDFRCRSGACIPTTWECDREVDCSDGSDEHSGCPPLTCGANTFTCGDGHCISIALTCNGIDDCGDKTDEGNCPEPAHRETKNEKVFCRDGEFACASKPSLCIPESARCNKTAECPKGEDERNCGCLPEDFECKNGKCIAIQWTCDKVDDCGDNSDEDPEDCSIQKALNELPPVPTGPCQDFICSTGECIPLSRVCDGIKDCKDESDENGKCRTSCLTDNHPCLGKCIPTPSGPRCSCNEGYELMKDGITCEDVDECEEGTFCSQHCENIPGSFVCSCGSDYVLRSDRRSCKATGSPMELIFASGSQIRKVSHSLSFLDVVHSGFGPRVTGLDVDSRRKEVYWSSEDQGSVSKISLETRQQITVTDLGRPSDLALDWTTGNIYFVDQSTNPTIKVCHLEEKRCAKVTSADDGNTITGITIDPIFGLLFWGETSWKMFNAPVSVIKRADLSGLNSVLLARDNIELISGLAADTVNNKLYWADQQRQQISLVGYNGHNRQMVIKQEVQRPKGLVLFEDALYWISSGSGQVTKCKLYGQPVRRCERLLIHAYDAEHFVIMQQARQKIRLNPCENHNCSHLCVISPHGAKCLCPDGKIAKPSKKCSNSNTTDEEIMTPRFFDKSESPKESSSGGRIMLIVVLVVLIMGILIASYYFIHHKYSMNPKLNLSFHFANPSFGLASGLSRKSVPSTILPGKHQYNNPMNLENEIVMSSKKEIPNSIKLKDEDDSEPDYPSEGYNHKTRLIP